jgi:hypothetical protein
MLLDVFDGEDHILGGEGISIMPRHVLSQIEDVSVIFQLPALSQSRNVAVLVLPDEGVEDHAHPDISRPARVVTVGRRKSPISGWVADGEHVYCLIGCY